MKLTRLTLSNTERISLISTLSTMLSAGIPILEAVDSLLEDSRGHTKIVLETLRGDLVQGKQIYTSLTKFPRIFGKVTVNLVKAAEQAGTLDTTLKDIKESIRREIEFTDKIKSSLIYPVLILFVFFGVLLMILVIVIPRISQVFSNLRVKLPLPTRIMIFLSNLLLDYTIFIAIGVVVFAILVVVLYRSKKELLFAPLFKLPLISRLVKEIDLTRFSRNLYLLLVSGLPITSALELSQEVVVRRETSKIIAHAKETVITGKKFSEGLRAGKGYIPTIMIKLIEAGEKSGTLDKSMQEVGEYMDYQVSNSLKTITILLEPVMLVFVGVFIGGMIMAIIAPIYNLIGQIGR
ncbi:type II secretion system F family protein [Candidatus Woesebacteria bacterium]|nr:type II secretion system F family protein [Candidatus Woesebacteria bacterium]